MNGQISLTDLQEWQAFLHKYKIPYTLRYESAHFPGPSLEISTGEGGNTFPLGGYRNCIVAVGFTPEHKFYQMCIWG